MFFLRVTLLLAFLIPVARADTLRLRDGTVITGTYVGGSQTEIWFQRGPSGAQAFPLYTIESVRFGNLMGSSEPMLPSQGVLNLRNVKLTHRPQSRPIALPSRRIAVISTRLSP